MGEDTAHPIAVKATSVLAEALADRGDLDEALKQYRAALALARRCYGDDADDPHRRVAALKHAINWIEQYGGPNTGRSDGGLGRAFQKRRATALVPEPVSHFTGREKNLDRLDTIFDGNRLNTRNSGSRCVLLHGVAGIGKTQLLLRYAELNKHRYTAGMFLLSGETAEELRASAIQTLVSPSSPFPLTIKAVFRAFPYDLCILIL